LEREAGIVSENAKLALEMSRVYSRLGDREKAHSQAQNAVRWRATESRIPEALRHWGPTITEVTGEPLADARLYLSAWSWQDDILRS
jgi:hypothetical protein